MGQTWEELDTKGLSGAHHFCLLTFDWLELSHMIAPNHKSHWDMLSLAGYHFPSGIFTALLGEHPFSFFLVDS